MAVIQDSAATKPYQELDEVELLGRRVKVLDLTRPLDPTIPIYPGHMKIAFWTHATHAETKMRLGDKTPWKGYATTGMVLCDHVSTHIDALAHFNADRPDLTVEKYPLDILITPAYWIDLSDAQDCTNMTVEQVKKGFDKAGIKEIKPGASLLYYTGDAKKWDRHMDYLTQYPGLSTEASEWILDQGFVNVLTDAPSTDNPSDLFYHNHQVHARRLIPHTELVNNIEKIAVHQGFNIICAPLRLTGATGSPLRIYAVWEA